MENSPNKKEDFNSEFVHYTVMLNEAVDALIPDGKKSDKIFVDATLGGGGHSALIASRLEGDGRLISFDVDSDAIKAASKKLESYENVTIVNDSYSNIRENLQKLGIEKITGGIIFDLGASYHQLTKAERGFSFAKDAPLDMRFNQVIRAESRAGEYGPSVPEYQAGLGAGLSEWKSHLQLSWGPPA